MRRSCIIAAAFLVLMACTNSSTMTAQQVYERLQKSGLASNGRAVTDTGTVFADCTDRYAFDVAPNMIGIAFICPKSTGDAIMAKVPTIPLAPHMYRSAGGTVLVSVVSTAPPDLASRIGDEVARFPE